MKLLDTKASTKGDVDLAALKALVASQDRRYPGWLDWQQRGNAIIAKPKIRLSDSAHKAILKVFRKIGGRYVSHNGEYYFEYVCGSADPSMPVAVDIKRAYEELMKTGVFRT